MVQWILIYKEQKSRCCIIIWCALLRSSVLQHPSAAQFPHPALQVVKLWVLHQGRLQFLDVQRW